VIDVNSYLYGLLPAPKASKLRIITNINFQKLTQNANFDHYITNTYYIIAIFLL